MSGYVGTSPGTLTVQVPYGDQVQLMGPRGLGMIDPTRYWNYGRDDGRSPLPVQPMFRIGSGGKVTGLSGPAIQLLGRPELQLMGRPMGLGLRQSHPNMQLMGRRDSPPDITLTGGRVVIPRPTLLGDPAAEGQQIVDAIKKDLRRFFWKTLLPVVAGVGVGVTIGALADKRGKKGVLIGAGAGAAVGAGAAFLLSPDGLWS